MAVNPGHQEQITQLLQDTSRSDEEVRSDLLPLVYEQLRQMARHRMNDQGAGHTLQPTALVHEAYLRLVGRADMPWTGRAHFYFAAGRAMQDILVEHARAKSRLKRGGAGGAGGAGQGRAARRVPLNLVDLATDVDGDEILALTKALERLEQQQPQVAHVVRLRFYAGLTCEQAAAALNVSERQVRRIWSYGRAWLYREVSGAGD